MVPVDLYLPAAVGEASVVDDGGDDVLEGVDAVFAGVGGAEEGEVGAAGFGGHADDEAVLAFVDFEGGLHVEGADAGDGSHAVVVVDGVFVVVVGYEVETNPAGLIGEDETEEDKKSVIGGDPDGPEGPAGFAGGI